MNVETRLEAFTDALFLVVAPDERVFGGFLLSSLVLASVVFVGQRRRTSRSLRAFIEFLLPRRVWLHRSARLDYQMVVARALTKALLVGPLVVQAVTVASLTAALLELCLGPSPRSEWSPLRVAAVYTVVAFMLDDLTRYLLHRAMHRVPLLWQLHQAHHSAEVLTPFTLYRTHPLETLLYALRASLTLGIATGCVYYVFRTRLNALDVLGVNLVGFAFNVLGANLRHSHVRVSFGRRVERWLISPAQHQIHHSRSPRHHDKNFGAFLAIWDRIGGTLHTTEHDERIEFGLDPRETNHAPTLGSLIVHPALAAARALRPGR